MVVVSVNRENGCEVPQQVGEEQPTEPDCLGLISSCAAWKLCDLEQVATSLCLFPYVCNGGNRLRLMGVTFNN